MNILTISFEYYPKIGGIATVVKEVAEGLAKKGHQCTLLTTGVAGCPDTEVHNNVKILRVSRAFYDLLYGLSPSLLIFLLRSRQWLRQFDLIHIHSYHTLFSIEAMLLCRMLKSQDCKVIFTPHYHAIGHTKFRNLLHRIYKPFGKYMFKHSDAVVCVSEYESSLVRDNFTVANDRLHIIPNGTAKRAPARKKSDRLTLLYVGYLREYKGVRYILHAVRDIIDRYKINPVLNIVGKGEDEEKFRSLARLLCIENNVTWRSNLTEDELNEKYGEADIFLLLSKAEAYGIVVADALMAGVPCIVANTSALKEFTREPGCFGIDYPPNIGKLSDMIMKIYRDSPRVGPFSKKIRHWEEIVEDYDRLYHRMIEGTIVSPPSLQAQKNRRV